MGVILLTFQMIFYTLVVILFLIVVPGIPPHYKFEPYSIRPPRKMEGKLTPNDILDRAELVVDGQFIGPESVAVLGNDVYTGCQGGSIIKVDEKGTWKKVAQIDSGDCDGSWRYPCPRPLGLRFAKNGKLIVADAHKGLLEVDVNTGVSKVILATGTIADDGEPINFPDDLDIDRDGNIYFSDASKRASMSNVYIEALGDATGRLMKFDPKKPDKVEVLISDIHFANGVQLSSKEDFVVICESMRSRLIKYHIQGPKKGTKENFVEGLPGVCDNVRSNGKGGFYVSLVMPDTEDTPNYLRPLSQLPSVRKVILRVQYALCSIFEIIDTYLPNPIVKFLHNYVSHLGPFGDVTLGSRKVIIVDIDNIGNVIGSLQNKNGHIAFISEIGLGKIWTYFGSPYSDKFWRIKTEYLV